MITTRYADVRGRAGRETAPLTSAGLLLLALLLPAFPGGSGPLLAQQSSDSTEAERTVLDSVYTEEQAKEGRQVFLRSCSGCHATGFFEAQTFIANWSGRPLRSLFRRLRQTMPEDMPGGLSVGEYIAVMSYILELNGYPAGETELPRDEDALRAILMVQKSEGGG